MLSPDSPPGGRERCAPGADAAHADEPSHTAAAAPSAAPPDGSRLRTAAALEVAVSSRGNNSGAFGQFEQVTGVLTEFTLAESAQEGDQYNRVLGGVRRQDAPDARAHQAAAGQARQALPDAAAQRAAASQRATEKRKTGAMSAEERKAKAARHMREMRAEAKAAKNRAAAEAAAEVAADAVEKAAKEAAAEEVAKEEREAKLFVAVNAAVVVDDFPIDDDEWGQFLRELDRVHEFDDEEVIEMFCLWRQEETAQNEARRFDRRVDAAEEDDDPKPAMFYTTRYDLLKEAVRQGVVDTPDWMQWWRPPAHMVTAGEWAECLDINGYRDAAIAIKAEVRAAAEERAAEERAAAAPAAASASSEVSLDDLALVSYDPTPIERQYSPTEGECCNDYGLGEGDDEPQEWLHVRVIKFDNLKVDTPKHGKLSKATVLILDASEPYTDECGWVWECHTVGFVNGFPLRERYDDFEFVRDLYFLEGIEGIKGSYSERAGYRLDRWLRVITDDEDEDDVKREVAEFLTRCRCTFEDVNGRAPEAEPWPEPGSAPKLEPAPKPKRARRPYRPFETPDDRHEQLVDRVNGFLPGTASPWFGLDQPGPPPPTARPPPTTHEERVKERERAAGLPPRREHYGDCDDAVFQGDRAEWYKAFTGEPLTGSLAEQNEKFDVVARRFREYSDGRVTRRERMED